MEAKQRAVDNLLIQEIENNRSPSVHYVIFDAEKILHRFQYGYSDIGNSIKASENTTYHAFSVTKTFTAVAVLQLAEQNRLDIDQPVKKYLSVFPYGDAITIRQLLSHAAGIPNPIPLSWIHLSAEHDSFDRNRFFQNIFNKNPKTSFKPNEKFAYSNLGYVLLGQLIEAVARTSYESYITENILAPLKISPGELSFTVTDKSRHAKGYHKKFSFSNFLLGFFIDKSKYVGNAEGNWVPFHANYVNGSSYGGLIGTPDAFVKYIRALLKPGSILLKEEYKKMLFTENFTTGNKPTGMCLSWFKGQLNKTTYYTHAGGGGGYYCEIRIYPEPGIGSVIMFNRSGMTDERFLDKTDKYFVSHSPVFKTNISLHKS